jgi:hypothetical protein
LYTDTAARSDYRVMQHNSRGATTHMYGRLLYDNTPRHVDMPLHTTQHVKRMNVCCRITTLEDSNFNQ